MTTLSIADRDLWRLFRRSYEHVSLAIERELVGQTALSGADHGILSRLAECDTDGMRQQDLADAMRWDRTRLSHHLTRMEQRDLVKRSKVERGGTLVAVTSHGDDARKAADPIHAAAVMTYFISRLTSEQKVALKALPIASESR